MSVRIKVTMVVTAAAVLGFLPPAPGAAQLTGAIAGTVANSETGEPLSGAQVSIPAL
ncbi:MAG: hypothetical protein OXI83_12975 [Gemmatimonadota bacterium]|nr:hypothetical protein [Gemmatimonadota bacterium]